MTLQLHALCFDAVEPTGLAHFWSGVLGWETVEDPRDGIALLPSDDTGFRIRFRPTQEAKAGPNQMHFDLTSTSLEAQHETVARALVLGGRHLGNSFLADCGLIGALSSDGLQEVGYFWSRALDWPLVWDQDEETAIRAPTGGPKINWGGPPVAPKVGKNRLRFELVPSPDTDQQAETDRLVSLGATRIDREVLADPGGNEFSVRRLPAG